MKHTRPDRTFIYYYHQMVDGNYIGVRVGRRHVWVIAGSDSNPERLPVQGTSLAFPISGETSESFENARGQLTDEHSELEQLLNGEIDFDQAVRDLRSQ